jgi:hypothetical protein
MPDLPECETCEFNKTIWQSQRGMLLVYGSTLLFLMWTIETILQAIYKVQPDNTIPLIFGAAVAGGYAFYFYSKTQTDKANIAAKLAKVEP